VVTFKGIPHSLFAWSARNAAKCSRHIQPEEGIALRFQAKRPGSKICMGTLAMNFSYKQVFGVEMPEAYQRLLLDCMAGDQTLFTDCAVQVGNRWSLPKREQAPPSTPPAATASEADAVRSRWLPMARLQEMCRAPRLEFQARAAADSGRHSPGTPADAAAERMIRLQSFTLDRFDTAVTSAGVPWASSRGGSPAARARPTPDSPDARIAGTGSPDLPRTGHRPCASL
jgi:hypothetical protein